MSPLGPMSFVLSQNLSKAKTDKTETLDLILELLFKNENITKLIINFFFYSLVK